MSLTLIRHASLGKSYQKRYIGWSDIDIDLNFWDQTKANEIKRLSFDSVYSSTLIRAINTLKELGFKEFILDDRLKEVAFKDHIEGKSFDEISKLDTFDSKFLNSMDSWHRFICKEDKNSFYSRVESFLSELPKDKEILICTHAGVIRVIGEILGHKIDNIDYLEMVKIWDI